jgi:hypothetical protein
MNAIFRLSSLLVLPFWVLMILLPRWRWTPRILLSRLVIAPAAAAYAALALPRLAEIWPAVSRPTLDGVAALLGSPAGATIAWIHFLAFDLFVGRWIYFDSQERRISAWVTSPALFLTLMLGPVGFLLYVVIRSLIARFTSTAEGTASHLGVKDPKTQPIAGVSGVASRSKEMYRDFLRRAFSINQPLTILGGVMLLVFLAALGGVLLDHQVITGAPAWLKPAKFAISISVYCFTFVWLLGFVENRPRLVRLVSNVTVIGFIVEMIAIVVQAARGTTSHFNISTPFNAVLWTMMGAFIVIVWAMSLLLAIMLILQRMPDRAFAWSLRLGVLISLAGMAAAFLMVRPTPGQLSEIASGHVPRTIGAHSVGVSDGGPGLPFVGWSTVGGDLRVAHFVGLHALQFLPFFGWLLTRRRGFFSRLSEGQRLTLVWTVGLTYLGLVLLLAWQALRGQSVISPDAKTMSVAGALASAAVTSILVTIARTFQTNGRASKFGPGFIGHES